MPLLVAGPGTSNRHAVTAPQVVRAALPIQSTQASFSRVPVSVGMGAGAPSGESTGATLPAASCNPFDVSCWLTGAAQWLAGQILDALQPVLTGLLQNPLNIIAQTPPADTYQNGTVIAWASAFLVVVDLALASLIDTVHKEPCLIY